MNWLHAGQSSAVPGLQHYSLFHASVYIYLWETESLIPITGVNWFGSDLLNPPIIILTICSQALLKPRFAKDLINSFPMAHHQHTSSESGILRQLCNKRVFSLWYCIQPAWKVWIPGCCLMEEGTADLSWEVYNKGRGEKGAAVIDACL